MPLTPDEREDLAAPYDDYQNDPPTEEPPEEPTVETIITRVAADAWRAKERIGTRAAVAIVIAIGNYEFLVFKRQDLLDALDTLLTGIDPESGRTRRWGP